MTKIPPPLPSPLKKKIEKNTEHIGEILMYVSACTLKIAKPYSSF